MDTLKLESLKNKDVNAQSAMSSQEVREHLAGFIRSKQQGSTTQLNSTKLSAHPSSCSAQSSSNGDYAPGYVSSLTNGGSQEDDHPLRKTASMPTMHIPYKAQSLSRRRQMERRTTMSPLMKRKSKPKRQLLHSLESNPAEYSSNPCILNSSKPNQRSLSQSSSPPSHSSKVNDGSGNPQSSTCQASTNLPSTSQTIKLSSIFSNRELENLQNDLKNSLYFSTTPRSSSTNLQQSVTTSAESINNNTEPIPIPLDGNALRQQQHLKVNEAIRKTVIQRASSRGKIGVGGSLDIEGSADKSSGNEKGKPFSGLKDELRQWSLDGADLRSSVALNSLSSGVPNASSIHREYHMLRLATTNDAASLRRSQSPSSSISMGLSGGQAAASMVQPGFANQTNAGHSRETRVATVTHPKHYSSSSSSNSSLLSQQDSLEESSHAIDLSSSSEANRQRYSQKHSNLFTNGGLTNRPQLVSHMINTTSHPNTTGQHYQKVLQDSFNQLQLCQSQERMGIKQLLLTTSSQPQSLAHQHHAVVRREATHPPSLSTTARTATSLDANSQPGSLMASLSESFNLSASAQNLISTQDNQHVQNTLNSVNPMLAHQQQVSAQSHDLNQWLHAYNNLIKSTEFQQSNQINSSLMGKISNLPEPYRSGLLSHIVQPQHTDISRSVNKHDQPREASAAQTHNQDEQGGLISRALSSPLLLSSRLDAPIAPVQKQRQITSCSAAPISLSHSRMEFVTTNVDLGNGVSGEGSNVDMIVDSAQELIVDTAPVLNTKTHSMVESNYSLDLTLSSRSSEDKSKSSSSKGEAPLNFSYTPSDPFRTNWNFIYNPIFDQNSSTGLIYELEMCNHKCICANENNHPENSHRILAIWRRLHERGLMARCARIIGRKASIEELQLCHSETYSHYFGKSPYERIKLSKLDLRKLPIEGLTQLECGGQGADIDTAWNEEQTPAAARLAAGCVIEAAENVANGKLMNAFAIVRPPGHHAEFQQAMGFCFFNSVAIAARVLINKHQLARVLVVDWDVHHGNGIQKAFYEDKSVMYISLHRHDKGNFFPGTGDTREVGSGAGEGFNWNIAWSSEAMGDAEYIAAFRTIVMPIARDFNPSMVLVACGFDASRGHPFNFGGYDLSPACFAYMTRQLMTVANGRVVLCLEGGYKLDSICDCAESCVRALLSGSSSEPSDQVSESEFRREPNQSASDVLFGLSNLAVRYWPSVERWRSTIDMSAHDAANVRC